MARRCRVAWSSLTKKGAPMTFLGTTFTRKECPVGPVGR